MWLPQSTPIYIRTKGAVGGAGFTRGPCRCVLSCATHTHTPAKKSSANFRLYPFLLRTRSANCLGHGHGYEWSQPMFVPSRALPRGPQLLPNPDGEDDGVGVCLPPTHGRRTKKPRPKTKRSVQPSYKPTARRLTSSGSDFPGSCLGFGGTSPLYKAVLRVAGEVRVFQGASLHIYIYIYMYVCMYVYVYVYVYMYIYIYMYILIYIYIHILVLIICMCICIYIYTYTYTHYCPLGIPRCSGPHHSASEPVPK